MVVKPSGPCRWSRDGRGRPPRPAEDSAGQAELGRAAGPRAVAAGRVTQAGGHGDLGLAGGLVRVARATVGTPGADVELEAAVVAVAGVDGPVAARLALRQGVPHGAAGGEVGSRLLGLLLGADRDDAGHGLAAHVGPDDLAGREVAVDEAELVGDVADAVATGAHDLLLPLEHGGVLALDDGGVDDLALDLLGGDADVG